MDPCLNPLHAWLRYGLLVLAAVLAAVLIALPAAQAGVNMPQLERGKGERCVEDPQVMRRMHMEFLNHHRDKTVREGVRTTRHSLKGCVECHAGTKTGSVAATREDFCSACHVFAAVRMDCWDCHATRPARQPAAHALPRAAASPLISATRAAGAPATGASQ